MQCTSLNEKKEKEFYRHIRFILVFCPSLCLHPFRFLDWREGDSEYIREFGGVLRWNQTKHVLFFFFDVYCVN
jgi:hypothetical protein